MLKRIRIIKWDSYNGRPDVKVPSWFRLDNKMFFDPEWAHFQPLEFMVWIWILSYASFKQKEGREGGSFDYDPMMIAASARVPVEVVENSVAKLCRKKCVTIDVVESAPIFEAIEDEEELLAYRNPDARVTPTLRPRNGDGRYKTGQDKTGQDKGREDRGEAAAGAAEAEAADPPGEPVVDLAGAVTLELELPTDTEARGPQSAGEIGKSGDHPLVEVWNEHRGTLPRAVSCEGSRKKHADARWKARPDRRFWAEIIERIAGSPFCCGESERGWRADFDFLVKPDTVAKVLEGKYDPRPGPLAPPKSTNAGAQIVNAKHLSFAQQRELRAMDQLARIGRGEL
jgi:hypothetical protein